MAIPEQSVQIIKDISQQHSTLTAQKINAAFVIFIYKQPVLIITNSCFILNHSSQIQQKITAAAPIS
ncbi:hypothetical protein, partial [Escherichia coli]|uniref:hypothetical protein n=1 Tax=Escherichia coli TaxID=562 RepID=UPI001ADE62E8